MVIYILTKFGADWLIFVDASVLTRKLWMDGPTSDGRTVSDHNSSLSTPCSGELIEVLETDTRKQWLYYIFCYVPSILRNVTTFNMPRRQCSLDLITLADSDDPEKSFQLGLLSKNWLSR